MIDRQRGVPIALGSRIPLASLIQMLAVAEHLSFYRAANALGISQSRVSTQIKALEGDLGIILFDRNTRGVRLQPNSAKVGRFEFLFGVADQTDQEVRNYAHPARLPQIRMDGEPDFLVDPNVGLHANEIVLSSEEVRQYGQTDAGDYRR